MPPEDAAGLRGLFVRGRTVLFPLLIVTSVLVIVAPLPPLLLDLLLACNITVGVIILLTTIYVNRPLEFSVFPAILLGATLARLVLNVASTPVNSDTRSHTRNAGGRWHHCRLWRLRRRWKYCHRADHLRDSRGDSVHGHHQGGHANQ